MDKKLKTEIDDVEIMIGKVMQIGVILAAVVIIFGLILLLVSGSTGYPAGVHPTRIGAIISGTVALKPYAILMTGIFLLKKIKSVHFHGKLSTSSVKII